MFISDNIIDVFGPLTLFGGFPSSEQLLILVDYIVILDVNRVKFVALDHNYPVVVAFTDQANPTIIFILCLHHLLLHHS